MPALGAADRPQPGRFWFPVICGAAILTIGIGARQSFGIFQEILIEEPPSPTAE